MKTYLKAVKRFLFVFTPVFTTSVLVNFPSYGATFSFAEGRLNIANVNQPFLTNDISNQAEIEGNTDSETAILQVDNVDVFNLVSSADKRIFSSAISAASGTGLNYSGLANTAGDLAVNFDINAGHSFQFDFAALLNLQTRIDTPPVEQATATGNLSFWLLDTTAIPQASIPDFFNDLLSQKTIPQQPLEFFSLSGGLNTLGNNDFLNIQNSDNITFNLPPFTASDFGNNNESAFASLGGSLNRSFDSNTNVTLFATRRTLVTAKAPEPSASVALILLAGLVAVATRNKHKISANLDQ